ncbi:MAG TPA: hypothetical protein VKG92_00550 [Flavobacteriales bacterium]|nr:hypothetical protein [Flavobacteriales bacterium]
MINTATSSLILAAFTLGSINAAAQLTDCSAVRTGRFLCENELGNTIIDRGDDEQVETALNEAWEMRLRVEWIDGCTYRLFPPPAAKDDKAGLVERLIVTTRVIEINELGYSALVWWDPPPRDTLLLHYKRLP